MQHRRVRRHLQHSLAVGSLLLTAMTSAASAQNGLLGIFFDDRASECAGNVPVGSASTLYVVLLPQGATRGGIAGSEFRIKTDDASGYLFQAEEVLVPGAVVIGDILFDGATMGFAECQNDIAIPILRFQVLNIGSGANGATISVTHKEPPSNPFFACPQVLQCDYPNFTKICVEHGRAVLNPSGQVDCGSSAESAEWSRVKELYR